MKSSAVETVIEPGYLARGYLKDLWRFRELLFFLAWRDILVRYKQTMIGILWALVRPILTMIILTIVFGKLAQLPSDGTPYPIMVFAAMLPWQFFANALSESSNSIVSNSHMISKVYFPRLIIPLSAVLVSFVDFLISGVILVALMAWYRVVPGPMMLTLPLFTLLAVLAAVGAGLWFSALIVKYRDVRFVVPFVVQLGVYVSPVGYSTSIVPEEWRPLYSLNPMVGVIDGFRMAIVGGPVELYWPSLIASVVLTVALLASGVRFFRSVERTIADVL